MSQRTIYHPLAAMFSSPCLGIFFYTALYQTAEATRINVFVPMFGDLFLLQLQKAWKMLCVMFSSPCLGIFFY